MPREQFQARLPEGDAQAVHDFAEALDIGKSEATKRLLTAGLDAETGSSSAAYLAETVALILAIAAAVIAPFTVPFPSLSGFAIGYLAVAVVAFLAALWARGARPGHAVAAVRGRTA